jgi:hypothetical protein
VEDVVRDPVALVLDGLDLAGEVLALREVREHLVEQLGRSDEVGRGLLEQVEELPVLRDEDLGQAGHRPSMRQSGERDVNVL